MRIDRVIIRGLRALRDRDDILFVDDGLCDGTVCLRGVNGSGKTTWMEAIAQLFVWFRRCAQSLRWERPAPPSLLAEAELVAVQLSGLLDGRAGWLACGDRKAIEAFRVNEGPILFAPAEGSDLPVDLLTAANQAFTRAEAGKTRTANLLLLEAESRWSSAPDRDELHQPGASPAWQLVARYSPQSRGPAHIEGLISTLKLLDDAAWEGFVRAVPQVQPGLALIGFAPDSRRPLFTVPGASHPLTLDRLSAGERAALINIVMVQRWLEPGGIVLIDEPELHQHLSMMRRNVAQLSDLIVARGGQLILASHSPEVWSYADLRGQLIDLSSPVA